MKKEGEKYNRVKRYCVRIGSGVLHMLVLGLYCILTFFFRPPQQPLPQFSLESFALRFFFFHGGKNKYVNTLTLSQVLGVLKLTVPKYCNT